MHPTLISVSFGALTILGVENGLSNPMTLIVGAVIGGTTHLAFKKRNHIYQSKEAKIEKKIEKDSLSLSDETRDRYMKGYQAAHDWSFYLRNLGQPINWIESSFGAGIMHAYAEDLRKKNSAASPQENNSALISPAPRR